VKPGYELLELLAVVVVLVAVSIPVRVAFFVVVGLTLVFGICPFRFEVAKNGIIVCVFGLVGVAVANVLLMSARLAFWAVMHDLSVLSAGQGRLNRAPPCAMNYQP